MNLAALASTRARARRAEFTRVVLTDLGRSASGVLDAPFLVDGRHRCRLSARIYHRSEALAGFAYRYFYAGIFTVFAVFVAAAASSVALLLHQAPPAAAAGRMRSGTVSGRQSMRFAFSR